MFKIESIFPGNTTRQRTMTALQQMQKAEQSVRDVLARTPIDSPNFEDKMRKVSQRHSNVLYDTCCALERLLDICPTRALYAIQTLNAMASRTDRLAQEVCQTLPDNRFGN